MPSQYFDIIGGTGTGGWWPSCWGSLGCLFSWANTISNDQIADEAVIDVYLEKVFHVDQILTEPTPAGDGKISFDHAILRESAIKGIVNDRLGSEDYYMCEASANKPKHRTARLPNAKHADHANGAPVIF
jgi:hypothetical protein